MVTTFTFFDKIDSFSGEYRFLSNFWPCEIKYAGIVYPSVENAYQAQKFIKSPTVMYQFKNISASKAKRLARSLDHIDPEWDKRKYFIMYDLVTIKFLYNEELKQKLINTGDALLIEGNSWGDTYWGVCDGVGDNNLGKILMNVRKRFIDGEYSDT